MIYYVCHYINPIFADEERVAAPAANNKAEYIIGALEEVFDGCIEVVSLCETRAHKLVKGQKISISDKVSLRTFTSIGSRFKVIRILGHFYLRLARLVYFLCYVKREDHIITYHSLSSMSFVNFIKKIKKCQLTVEVEELYSDVRNNRTLRKKELKRLSKADSYISITKVLNEIVNTDKKPYAISHGTYKTVPKTQTPPDDGKIYIIYAGTMCPIKGGAYNAVNAARFLDERFVVDIMGSGNKKELEDIKELINTVSKDTKCTVRYMGFKTGEAFNECVQSHHIGLSTQSMDGAFGDTSFPSKILMYMSNGLKVVSLKIPAIESSDVGDSVFYYDFPEPECIAKAIYSAVETDSSDGREVLRLLDKHFTKELTELLYN